MEVTPMPKETLIDTEKICRILEIAVQKAIEANTVPLDVVYIPILVDRFRELYVVEKYGRKTFSGEEMAEGHLPTLVIEKFSRERCVRRPKHCTSIIEYCAYLRFPDETKGDHHHVHAGSSTEELLRCIAQVKNPPTLFSLDDLIALHDNTVPAFYHRVTKQRFSSIIQYAGSRIGIYPATELRRGNTRGKCKWRLAVGAIEADL